MLVRVGCFGPMAQIGTGEETEKPRYAKLRNDQRLDTITFEEAMDLFVAAQPEYRRTGCDRFHRAFWSVRATGRLPFASA